MRIENMTLDERMMWESTCKEFQTELRYIHVEEDLIKYPEEILQDYGSVANLKIILTVKTAVAPTVQKSRVVTLFEWGV